MVQFRYPLRIDSGDEIIGPALILECSRRPVRISYLWGTGSQVEVLGAHMVKPNVFEFPPHKEAQTWYLKFTVAPDVKHCHKVPYITVHELIGTRWPLYFARLVALGLFIVAPLLLIIRFAGGSLDSIIDVRVMIGPLVVVLPITLVLLLVFWSSRVTEFIRRLFILSLEKAGHYRGKGIPNGEEYHAKGVPDKYRPMMIERPRQNIRRGDTTEWSDWYETF